jgi:ABC-type transport system involved in multi-copper enzyme maturation permease subunit
MYAWKCWRETRVNFYVFLFMAVTSAALLWKFVDASELPAKQLFPLAWVMVLVASRALLPLAGISFGSTGISEEFAHKTAGFLLTKPRSIRYFVWTAWATNAVQFLALTVSMLFAGAVVLSWRYHAQLTGRLLLAFLPGLIMTFVMFGMTYLLGVLHKNGRNGFLSSLGVVIVFPFICLTLEHFWQIHFPSPADMYAIGMVELFSHPELASTLPRLWPLIGWSLVALAFPFIAQLVLQRTEL